MPDRYFYSCKDNTHIKAYCKNIERLRNNGKCFHEMMFTLTALEGAILAAIVLNPQFGLDPT